MGIASACSTDGPNRGKEAGPLLDSDMPSSYGIVSEPCVIDLDDGRYRLSYAAKDKDGCCIPSAT